MLTSCIAYAALLVGASETSTLTGLAAFTLLRGGSMEDSYEKFLASRRSLRDKLPDWVQYDDVAFHVGNVPLEIQFVLLPKL